MRWHKIGLVFAPPRDLTWMVSHASVPCAQPLAPALYRVFFSGRDPLGRSHVGHFELNLRAPNHAHAVSATSVLAPGDMGAFDDSGAMATWVLDHRGTVYMYYIGWTLGKTVPFHNSVGLAVSQDRGLTFSKVSRAPVLGRDEHDPYFTGSACVLIEGGIWRMWYLSCVRWTIEGGKPKHFYHIKYAESADGVVWTRNGRVCIDFKSPQEYAISRPSVVKDGDVYRMWYSYRGERYRIGYAESPDGLTWTRYDEKAGIDVSPNGWDSDMIEYPLVFDDSGYRHMLYNGNGYGETGIGLALLATDTAPVSAAR